MLISGAITAAVNSLENLLPCQITLWYRQKIIFTTLPSPHTLVKEWPIIGEAQQLNSSVVINSPRQHHLCLKCPVVDTCSTALELFFPFLENSQEPGSGVCLQFTQTALDYMKTLGLNPWLRHLKNYAEHIEFLLRQNAQIKKDLLHTQQIHYLLSLIPEGVVLMDEQREISTMNEPAEKLKLPHYLENNKNPKSFKTLGNNFNLMETPLQIQVKNFYHDKKFIGALYHSQNAIPTNPTPQRVPPAPELPKIIGKSPALQKIISMVKQVAGSESTILLRGESGTGKELFAHSIHELSLRSGGPFVAINCAAIPESLLESELFGYEEGSFTGAKKGGKPGIIELANNGTLFLDEIGDMPLTLQAKLLRVIQEKSIERVGGSRPISINIRLVAATHRNLEEMIEAGTFREDLFFRLNVIPIFIPPLRQRPEDIELLLNYYLRKYCLLLRKPFRILSYAALQKLLGYNWPGNIRELENMVEYLVNIHNQEIIAPGDLPLNIRQLTNEKTPLVHTTAPLPQKTKEQRSQQEIIDLLNRYGWHTEGKKRVAAVLGISLATLYRRIKKYKIKE
ncbi:sigma-54 interaction domain-containing protein [Desulfotomaculum sp. 1211_IL3151]|uniref:sigma-54 interaction domain-containing protein n=1 Tax=Desulfotomaculum sp. 1211_IL3151 TaxID=3084055 RepID=UPI002FDABD16